jgi:hypothetical protein
MLTAVLWHLRAIPICKAGVYVFPHCTFGQPTKVITMYARESNRFSRPFAEVWQHLPFHPSASLSRFVERFMIAGRFDAERFWEFVAAVSGRKGAMESVRDQ